MGFSFGRVGIYNEKFPSIMPPNPLITWSCKITYIVLAAVSLLPLDLWPPNWAKWGLNIRNFYPLSHEILSACGHVRSFEKLKTFYFY